MNNNEKTLDTGRIGWLERDGYDFPYYNGVPVGLTGMQWILVLIGVAVGFFALIYGIGRTVPVLTRFVPVFLYVGTPLAALAFVSKGHWTALFRRISGRDVLLMIVFAILNIVVTLVAGFLLIDLDEATTNATSASFAELSAGGLVLAYLRTGIQLIGEEIMTILPFLALMYLFVSRVKMGRVTAILLAWVITAILFAAEHLPTYGWNIAQTLGGVGIARLVLTLPYIMTKNLWVSSGAHILNDWIMFTLPLLTAGAAAAAD